MDKRIEDFLSYAIFGVLLAAHIFMIFDNISEPWLLIGLTAVFILMLTFLQLYSRKDKLSYIDLLVLLEIALVFAIGLLDKGSSYMVYYFCIGVSVILTKGVSIGFCTFISCYAAYVAGLFYKLAGQALWATTLTAVYNILVFAVVYVFTLILKYVIAQNSELRRVTKELRLKTIEQEDTFNKLLTANKELEELAVLKERNRMAREIHDTIGHRLTTAIVEMEAGKTIYEGQQTLAMEKFSAAQQQIKNCLSEVRTSVRTLREYDINDFSKLVLELIEDTQKHTGITIKHDIMSFKNPPSQTIQKTLYRVIQEGITNSIRHGESTVIVLTLNAADGSLRLLLQDNGKGCSLVVKGFGLCSMEERLREVGGSLYIESEEEEGFTLQAEIPFRGSEGESNE